MKRRALVIGNPGEKGKENYCSGVLLDMTGYRDFLCSPIGGAWAVAEVELMLQPSAADVLAWRYRESSDYAFVAFSGHGEYCPIRRSTILELRQGQELDSAKLRGLADRQTLILDCCRLVAEGAIMESATVMAKRAAAGPNPARCRAKYDQAILSTHKSLVVLNSCRIGETSKDDAQTGGYYSHALISTGKDWASAQTSTGTLSVVAAHQAASNLTIARSRGTQNPADEKDRTGPYFPFAVYA